MTRRMWLGAVAVMLVTLPGWAQQKLYRWTDADGRVFYTNKPPPGEARNVEQKKLGSRAGTGPLPYEVQVAARRFPVVLYATDCGEACDGARKLLDKRGVPYTERNAQDAEVQAEIQKLTGDASVEVPILRVGQSLSRGWEEVQWNAALDAAGYPKTSQLPRSVPARKAPPKKAPAAAAAADPAAAEPPVEGKPSSRNP